MALIKCPKCNNEISDESVFCPKCGYKILSEENTDKAKIKSNKVAKNIAVILSALVIVVVLCIVAYFEIGMFQKVNKIEKYMDDAQYTEAAKYYSQNLDNSKFVKMADSIVKQAYEDAVKSGDSESEIAIFNSNILNSDYISVLKDNILNQIDDTKKQYTNEEIKYEDAVAQIDKYQKYSDKDISQKALDSINNIQALYVSRQAYENGLNEIENGDYENALKDLSSVINNDPNFSDAQNKIKEIVLKYKEEVLANADAQVAVNDYSSAITALQTLENYYFDTDIDTKLNEIKNQQTAFEQEQKNAQIQSYKDNQEVEVTSTNVRDDGYTMTFMKAEVNIKNNSGKVAKDVDFSLLLFDGNGYPVDVEYKIYQGKYGNEFNCSHESCNVEPGKTYGSDWEFSIPDKCKQVKACVTNVRYTDGTTWHNPYYDYWIEENYSMY